MTRHTLIALAIVVAALLTGLLYTFGGQSGARVLVATPFLLIGPGLGLVRLLRIGDALTAGTLAVAVSLGLEAVVATGLLVGGWWSPGRALAIVIAITLAATAWSLVTDRGRGRRRNGRGARGPVVTTPGGTA